MGRVAVGETVAKIDEITVLLPILHRPEATIRRQVAGVVQALCADCEPVLPFQDWRPAGG